MRRLYSSLRDQLRWCALMRLLSGVVAHSHYQALIPNGRYVPGISGFAGGAWHAVGHIAPRPQEHPAYILDGFPRNPFGRHFMLAGRRWTVDLCQTDSDGDGLTNGQELGDPHCVWQPGEAPARAHNISHPGMDEASMRRFVEKKRSRGDGWSSAGLSQDPFTWILFYYQFVVIPILLGSAIGASCAARQLTSWRRHGAARFPSFLGIFAAYWLIFIVGVGCGVHRYFSHKSYTATRPWKLFLAWLSLLVGQGGPLDWAYVHRIHHRLCDDELDYHSPLNADVSHSVGLFGLKGFIYAHATWLVTPHKHVRRSPKLESHLVPDIVHDPDLLWFNDFVAHNPLLSKGIVGWILPGVTLGLLYLCTALVKRQCAARRTPRTVRVAEPAPPGHAHAVGGSSVSCEPAAGSGCGDGEAKPGVSGVAGAEAESAVRTGMSGMSCSMMVVSGYCFAIYYFYVPVALAWLSTAFVNSATHLWGDAPFDDAMISSCTSYNNAFLFFPMLGENWHNNHHASPGSASTWVVWYQIDFIYLTLRFVELFGLVYDIRVEVPSQPPNSSRPPPTGVPLGLWSLWLIIFVTVWHMRKHGCSRAMSKAALDESFASLTGRSGAWTQRSEPSRERKE